MRCAEPPFCAQFGSTPLHYAAAGGHADVAKALLEWGADARATDAVRCRCGCATRRATAAHCYAQGFRFLVALRSADALRFQGGWTALHWTAERGHSAVASQLLAAGADARAANRVGVTPLHSAAEKNAGPVAALLLRAGADPRAANAVGDTPLHWCAAFRGKGGSGFRSTG
jgi:ankyrin repeat protein